MKDFFNNISDRIRRMMAGRYGADDFSKFLLGATLVLLLLSLFSRLPVFYLLALASLIYSYYRMFSRDFAKRRAENEKYLSMTADLRRKARIGPEYLSWNSVQRTLVASPDRSFSKVTEVGGIEAMVYV